MTVGRDPVKSFPNSKKAQFIKHEMLEMSKEDVVENIAMSEADFDGQEIKMNIIVNRTLSIV